MGMKVSKRHGGMPTAMLQSICGQLALILLPVFLFAAGGVTAYRRTGDVSLKVMLLPVICGAVLLGFAGGWLALKQRGGVHPLAALRSNAALFAVLAVSLLLRLPQWGTTPRGDGAEYYGWMVQACSTFRFGIQEFIERFRLAAHPTWGLASLAAIPELFMGGNYNSFLVFQIGISLAAIYCVYDLLRRAAGCGAKTAALGAFAVGCAPMFLGLVSYPSLEIGMAVFFLYTLWAYSRQFYLLTLFCALLTVTSKEYGIVLLAGFFLGVVVAEYLESPAGPWTQRLRTALLKPRMVMLWLPGLMMGVGVIGFLLFTDRPWVDLGAVFGEGLAQDAPGNAGSMVSFLLYKIKEVLFCNFGWLLVALLLLCLLWRHRSKADALPCALRKVLFGAAGAAVLVTVMLAVALRLSYALARYNLVIQLLLLLCTVCLLCATLKERWRTVVLAGLSVLLAVQAYVTVDPLMTVAYPKVETGALPLARINYSGGEHMGDYLVYNYHYTYLHDGVEEILQSHPPTEYDLVVLGKNNWLHLGIYLWNPETNRYSLEIVPGMKEIFLYQTGNDSFHTALAADELQDKAVLLPSLLEAGEQNGMAGIPPCYTNVQQHIWNGGLWGKIPYYTAELKPTA